MPLAADTCPCCPQPGQQPGHCNGAVAPPLLPSPSKTPNSPTASPDLGSVLNCTHMEQRVSVHGACLSAAASLLQHPPPPTGFQPVTRTHGCVQLLAQKGVSKPLRARYVPVHDGSPPCWIACPGTVSNRKQPCHQACGRAWQQHPVTRQVLATLPCQSQACLCIPDSTPCLRLYVWGRPPY